MDFWDRMRNAIDKGIDSSRGFLSKAQDRARDLSERGVLRFEIMQLESQAEKLTAKLGSRAYEVLEKEGQNTISKNTPGVKDIIREIADIEERVRAKEGQLAAVAQREEEAGEARPADESGSVETGSVESDVRSVGPEPGHGRPESGHVGPEADQDRPEADQDSRQ